MLDNSYRHKTILRILFYKRIKIYEFSQLITQKFEEFQSFRFFGCNLRFVGIVHAKYISEKIFNMTSENFKRLLAEGEGMTVEYKECVDRR